MAFLIFGLSFPFFISAFLQYQLGSNTSEQWELIKKELTRAESCLEEKPDHETVQNFIIGKRNSVNVWIVGMITILIPLTIGFVFDTDQGFPFVLGSVISGFYLAANSMLTAGLLESSKQWMIFKMKYNVPEMET